MDQEKNRGFSRLAKRAQNRNRLRRANRGEGTEPRRDPRHCHVVVDAREHQAVAGSQPEL